MGGRCWPISGAGTGGAETLTCGPGERAWHSNDSAVRPVLASQGRLATVLKLSNQIALWVSSCWASLLPAKGTPSVLYPTFKGGEIGGRRALTSVRTPVSVPPRSGPLCLPQGEKLLTQLQLRCGLAWVTSDSLELLTVVSMAGVFRNLS